MFGLCRLEGGRTAIWALLGHLDALGAVLEASWARRGSQDVSKLASQIEGKSKKDIQKSLKISMPSKIQLLCNVG